MGSTCRIVVDGAAGLAARARSLVELLEAKWSRFDPESEVSAVNQNAGNVQLVSSETFQLFDHAVVAQRATCGRYNPLMLHQLIAHGYTRTWADGPAGATTAGVAPATFEMIDLLPEVNGVRIPPGSAFDPGGIGKGLAADLVTEFLIMEGSTTTSVELGGDLRVHGVPWYGPAWRIGVAHPFDAAEIGAFTPTSGAAATSSRLKKQWRSGGRTFHHLLDPLTGEPADTDLVAVSCCAATAWWAEVAAKAVLISGSDGALELFELLGVHGIAVTEAGDVLNTGGADEPAHERTREGSLV